MAQSPDLVCRYYFFITRNAFVWRKATLPLLMPLVRFPAVPGPCEFVPLSSIRRVEVEYPPMPMLSTAIMRVLWSESGSETTTQLELGLFFGVTRVIKAWRRVGIDVHGADTSRSWNVFWRDHPILVYFAGLALVTSMVAGILSSPLFYVACCFAYHWLVLHYFFFRAVRPRRAGDAR